MNKQKPEGIVRSVTGARLNNMLDELVAWVCFLTDEDIDATDEDVEARIKAASLRVMGNRNKRTPITYADVRLLFAAVMRESISILEDE
jgi:hypothetical protein